MNALRAYLAAALLAVPVGACLELSARAPGHPPSTDRGGLSSLSDGCWSTESCEVLP